jgi:ubiquinone/menaquinone biosynthesis C-methylase UbiE
LFNSFDRFANSYDLSIPPLPEEYVQLIQRCFCITENDMVVDLGSGSGILSFALARFSSNVQGVDVSKQMLEIARSRDAQRQIHWTCCPVEEFDFGYNNYKLIISFEAFHLFSDFDELIRKCVLALTEGGYLSIGWVEYEWELPLKDVIMNTFSSYGVEWGTWGYNSCPSFSEVIEHSHVNLLPIRREKIEVEVKTYISDIATFLTSIDKAAILNAEKRKELSQELEGNFKKIYSSEWSSGIASYFLSYCKKA